MVEFKYKVKIKRELLKIIWRAILLLEYSNYLDYRSIGSNYDSAMIKGSIGDKFRNAAIRDKNREPAKTRPTNMSN